MQRHPLPLASHLDVLHCTSLLRKPRTGMYSQIRLSCYVRAVPPLLRKLFIR